MQLIRVEVTFKTLQILVFLVQQCNGGILAWKIEPTSKRKKSQVKELEKPRTLSRALIIDDKARIMGGLTRGGGEENRTKLATPFRLLFYDTISSCFNWTDQISSQNNTLLPAVMILFFALRQPVFLRNNFFVYKRKWIFLSKYKFKIYLFDFLPVLFFSASHKLQKEKKISKEYNLRVQKGGRTDEVIIKLA